VNKLVVPVFAALVISGLSASPVAAVRGNACASVFPPPLAMADNGKGAIACMVPLSITKERMHWSPRVYDSAKNGMSAQLRWEVRQYSAGRGISLMKITSGFCMVSTGFGTSVICSKQAIPRANSFPDGGDHFTWAARWVLSVRACNYDSDGSGLQDDCATVEVRGTWPKMT